MSTPNSAPSSTPVERLTLRQLAKVIGVDAGQLSKESHRPGFPGHATAAGTLYDADEVLAWRTANVRQKKSAAANPDPPTPPPTMPAAGRVDRPTPARAMPPGSTESAPAQAEATAPEPSRARRITYNELATAADAGLIEILQSDESSSLDVTRAVVQIVARRVGRAHKLGTLGANDLDGLKKALAELRTAEASYLALEEEQRRLIARDDVKAIVAELCLRLVTALDVLETRLATQFSIWLADPATLQMGADDRLRMIRSFITNSTRAARIQEADDIERLLKQSRADAACASITIAHRFADLWTAAADTLRPFPDMPTSEFAERFRKLHREYCVENPGDWRSEKFPYQPDVMNAVDEAIDTGKKGVVFMKAGQIGGTDCMINALCKLKARFPGPALFMTSTDEIAEEEFGGLRFRLVLRDMEPLRCRQLDVDREKLLVKRFRDGNLVICGGQSANKLQSRPFRFVMLDELDSLSDNLGGGGDPVALAMVRTSSFETSKLVIAYAHPSVKKRGAGKLYYEQSDQRRGHIRHGCGHEFWLDWFNRDVFNFAPRLDGQSIEQAERDADCWFLQCPGCGQRISEEQRVTMLMAGVRQKSVLPPEEAAKKQWVGVHASQLYKPGDTVRSFAQQWIDTDCGRDENLRRVFVNKILGDVDEPKVKEVTIDALRRLIVVKRREQDPEFYSRGQVPPWVLFLTAGQDSRHKELHYDVWGWGVRETVDKTRYLCGALIDYGEIKRQSPGPIFTDAEYHVFDNLIYAMRFPAASGDSFYTVRSCGHDVGYQPTQIPVIRFCRSWPGRATPCKGASQDHSSSSKADAVRKGTAKRFEAGDVEAFDDPQLIVNTYLLKVEWYGWVEQRIVIPDIRDGHRIGEREVPRLALPEDVGELWLQQSKNEKLVAGKRRGELIWIATGPNHLADCNIYALGAALYLDPHSKNLTTREYLDQHGSRLRRPSSEPPRRNAPRDPAMG